MGFLTQFKRNKEGRTKKKEQGVRTTYLQLPLFLYII